MFKTIIHEGIKVVERGIVGGFDVGHAQDCKAEFGIRELEFYMKFVDVK